MDAKLAGIAALPMELLETHDVSCGYERSFKFTARSIQANRYVLGVKSRDLSRSQWQSLAEDLGIPDCFLREFLRRLADSSTVLTGFDLGADNRAGYKIYLEFMKDMPPGGRVGQAFDLGIGFKWQSDQPDNNLLSRYTCHPGLTSSQILQQVEDAYSRMSDDRSKPGVLAILERAINAARARRGVAKFIYLSVSDRDSPRLSFDVNLYPANLRVSAVAQQLDQLARAFELPEGEYAHLRALTDKKPLGHISAGLNSAGAAYFSLYYEAC